MKLRLPFVLVAFCTAKIFKSPDPLEGLYGVYSFAELDESKPLELEEIPVNEEEQEMPEDNEIEAPEEDEEDGEDGEGAPKMDADQMRQLFEMLQGQMGGSKKAGASISTEMTFTAHDVLDHSTDVKNRPKEAEVYQEYISLISEDEFHENVSGNFNFYHNSSNPQSKHSFFSTHVSGIGYPEEAAKMKAEKSWKLSPEISVFAIIERQQQNDMVQRLAAKTALESARRILSEKPMPPKKGYFENRLEELTNNEYPVVPIRNVVLKSVVSEVLQETESKVNIEWSLAYQKSIMAQRPLKEAETAGARIVFVILDHTSKQAYFGFLGGGFGVVVGNDGESQVVGGYEVTLQGKEIRQKLKKQAEESGLSKEEPVVSDDGSKKETEFFVSQRGQKFSASIVEEVKTVKNQKGEEIPDWIYEWGGRAEVSGVGPNAQQKHPVAAKIKVPAEEVPVHIVDVENMKALVIGGKEIYDTFFQEQWLEQPVGPLQQVADDFKKGDETAEDKVEALQKEVSRAVGNRISAFLESERKVTSESAEELANLAQTVRKNLGKPELDDVTIFIAGL
eukprot:GHVP01023988.1.p1 GENE.GHVP01023988.1~~GHVP01023988.1.p1  ORF type:complete len:564 (+),score=147.26 GHVP01023988.1:656-2347(+)